MRNSDAPSSVRSLEQRMRNLAGEESLALRIKTIIALVVVGQMMPEGVVKGGSAMALRFGLGTRFTQDFDASRMNTLPQFREAFELSLATGWQGFTGRLIEKKPPRPPGIPGEYVMQPFDIKLSFCGKSWCTVKFELGQDELGSAAEPESFVAEDLVGLFTTIGLSAPMPIPVLRSDYQIAQKIHAISSPASQRARDLVDLQLLAKSSDFDEVLTAQACTRTFAYRQQHAWPPTLVIQENWASLYAQAAEGIDVLATIEEAVDWAHEFIHRLTKVEKE